MKIKELVEELLALGKYEGRTCDTYKTGDGENELTGVAVSMFATPNVVREAAKIGANFLIVHEPTFYDHWDENLWSDLAKEKKKFIEDLGITVFRFHDHAHFGDYDIIGKGEFKYMGLDETKGRLGLKIIPEIHKFFLNEPMTAIELARLIEDKLGVKHVRIAGDPNHKGTVISGNFGTPGGLYEGLASSDFVITGEICEWEMGEYVRDHAQLGHGKAMLVVGHIGSERAGMMYLRDMLVEKHPELAITYIESGEVYSYTD